MPHAGLCTQALDGPAEVQQCSALTAMGRCGVWERDRRNGGVGSLGKGKEPQETSQLGPSRKQEQPPHPVTVGEGRGGCLGFLSSSTSLAWRPQVPQDNDSNCSTAGLPVCEAGRGWSRGGLGEWQKNPGMAAFLGAA